MIKRAIAKPRMWMEENKEKLVRSGCPIISITETGLPHVFEPSDNILCITIDDIDPINKWLYGKLGLPCDWKVACAIVNFIDKHNLRSDKAGEILVANCMMGVSRSGAIVDFASNYLHLDRKTFVKDNPFIIPNVWISNLLASVAIVKGMKK